MFLTISALVSTAYKVSRKYAYFLSNFLFSLLDPTELSLLTVFTVVSVSFPTVTRSCHCLLPLLLLLVTRSCHIYNVFNCHFLSNFLFSLSDPVELSLLIVFTETLVTFPAMSVLEALFVSTEVSFSVESFFAV